MNYDQTKEVERIRKMEAGREMDLLVAQKIFGIKKIYYEEWDEEKESPMYIPSGKPWRTHKIDAKTLPAFSQYAAPAIQVAGQFFRCKIDMVPKLERCVCLLWNDELTGSISGEGKTLPLAICRAALLRRILNGESEIRPKVR